jgi:hypothetical protein
VPVLARPRALSAVLAGLVGAGLALSTVAAAPAEADPQQRPIANSDVFSVYASGEYSLDVLANDEVTFLSSGDLTLCGVDVDEATQRVLYAEIDRDDPTKIFIETNRNADGVVAFTYDACQGGSRDTTTVALDITKLQSPRVVKHKKRRGRIAAANRNDVDLMIVWGSNRTNVVDGSRVIPADARIRIKVKRKRVFWTAFLLDGESVILAGDGTVDKIKKKKKKRKK